MLYYMLTYISFKCTWKRCIIILLNTKQYYSSQFNSGCNIKQIFQLWRKSELSACYILSNQHLHTKTIFQFKNFLLNRDKPMSNKDINTHNVPIYYSSYSSKTHTSLKTLGEVEHCISESQTQRYVKWIIKTHLCVLIG